MRLWILSDLHQEVARFPWHPDRPEFDVLVVAGDVFEGEIERGIDWVAELADGRPGVFVAGNHEFWGRTVEEVIEAGIAHAARRGVTFLHGQGWVEAGGVNFTGCTLWTDQSLNLPVGQRLFPREFGEQIDVRGPGIDRRVKGRDMLRLHKADLAALEKDLGAEPLPDGPRVVVTHHAPHIESLSPTWRHHPMGAASASDLTHLLVSDAADLWVHGHIHSNADYVPGDVTRVLCNPMGLHGSNFLFREDLVVEVGGPAPMAGPA